MFRSKIHRARVTEANLYYEGSITIDSDLLRVSTLLPYEKVQVVNVNNGARLETYIIPGEAGTGIVCLNGPAARLAAAGDEVVVIAYADMTPEEARRHRPRVVLVDADNRAKDVLTLDVALHPGALDALPDVVPADALTA